MSYYKDEAYCSVEDVLNITHSKPKHFGFKGENAEREFKDLINSWILQSESHINAYCKRNWHNEKVPFAVKDVCIRLTANMILFSHGRRGNPLKDVEDWGTHTMSSRIFTDDLRQDLKPFCKPKKARVFRL